MKICITSQGDKSDAKVEARFGRSPYFIIYDSESGDFVAIKNPNINASAGAGVQSAQMIADKNIEVILTGNQPGPKAAQILEAASIKVITGLSGTVKDVIDHYQTGDFSSDEAVTSNAVTETTQQKNIEDSGNLFGRGKGNNPGCGHGRGQGRGRGGCGLGAGQGRGSGAGIARSEKSATLPLFDA